MHWYSYVGCFFAGMFLANAVPHFVHGISGDPFPTPFAKPPGKVDAMMDRERKLNGSA